MQLLVYTIHFVQFRSDHFNHFKLVGAMLRAVELKRHNTHINFAAWNTIRIRKAEDLLPISLHQVIIQPPDCNNPSPLGITMPGWTEFPMLATMGIASMKTNSSGQQNRLPISLSNVQIQAMDKEKRKRAWICYAWARPNNGFEFEYARILRAYKQFQHQCWNFCQIWSRGEASS